MNLKQAFGHSSRLHHHPIGRIIDTDKWYEVTIALYEHTKHGDTSSWVLMPENPIALKNVTIIDYDMTFEGKVETEWPFPHEGQYIDAIAKAMSYIQLDVARRGGRLYKILVQWEDGTRWIFIHPQYKGDNTSNIRVTLTKNLMENAIDLPVARKILGLCEF